MIKIMILISKINKLINNYNNILFNNMFIIYMN